MNVQKSGSSQRNGNGVLLLLGGVFLNVSPVWFVLAAAGAGMRAIFVPAENAQEAAVAPDLTV